MVARYVEQQPAIFTTILSKDVKKNLKDVVTISEEEMRILEDIVTVLKPLKTVTTLMCDTKHPTISLIHPLKEMLIKQLAVKEGDSSVINKRPMGHIAHLSHIG
jgi:hypothetical protein